MYAAVNKLPASPPLTSALYPTAPLQEECRDALGPFAPSLQAEACILAAPRQPQPTSPAALTNDQHPEPIEQGAVTVITTPMAPQEPNAAPLRLTGSNRKWKQKLRKSLTTAGLPIIELSTLLENSDNVGREHLASERTFLAYVRTGIAIVSTGVVLVQLFAISDATLRNQDISLTIASRRIERFARPLGLVLVALGFSVLVIGLYRYLSIQSALQDQKYPVARASTVFISFVLGTVTAVLFGAVLRGNPSS